MRCRAGTVPNAVARYRLAGSTRVKSYVHTGGVTYLTFIPANLGILPFDIPEAEAEVLEGPLVEYSGPPLGLLKLTSAIKTVVVIGLGIAMFFPVGPSGIFGLVVFMVMVLAVSVLKAASAARGSTRPSCSISNGRNCWHRRFGSCRGASLGYCHELLFQGREKIPLALSDQRRLLQRMRR